MAGVYSVRAFSGATPGNGGDPWAVLWNPDSTKRIEVLEFGFYKTLQTSTRFRLARCSTRGTAGSTETPDGDNAWANDGEVPPSGAVLDVAPYSVDPTSGTGLWSEAQTGGAGGGGTGFVWTFEPGFVINPGTGLGIFALASGIMTAEFYAVWAEE
jgi:hypothetical protein